MYNLIYHLQNRAMIKIKEFAKNQAQEDAGRKYGNKYVPNLVASVENEMS